MSSYNHFTDDPAWEIFTHEAFSGRTAHAYLVLGPRGSGKRAFAMKAAGALLCISPENGKACGRCPSCSRAEKEIHPDLMLAAPQKSTMGVDEIRAVLDELTRRPFEGGRRAVVFENAEKMTHQAQNALLKTLEEPNSGTVFFILSENDSAMLSTVRSRCRLIRMRPDSTLVAKLTARGHDETLARELALYSGGSMGSAFEAAESAEALAARGLARRLLESKGEEDIPALWSLIQGEKDSAPLILRWLEIYLADSLRAACGAVFFLPESKNNRFTTARIQDMIETVIRTKQMLSSNVTWASAAGPLLRSIAGKTSLSYRFLKGEPE